MTLSSLIVAAGALHLAECQSAPVEPNAIVPSPEAAPSQAQGKVQMGDVTVEEQGWKMTPVATGIRRPWGMTWLPDGRILVTQKEGGLAIVKGSQVTSIPIENCPPVFSGGQGGVMDVILHPDFASNKYVYVALSSGTGAENRTVLIRGKFAETKIAAAEFLFGNAQMKNGGLHFGCRLLWLPDKTLMMTIGEGNNMRPFSQDKKSHFGKVLRLTETGKPAKGNPFESDSSFAPEVWSYGHRNPQGIARDDKTGRIYVNEHGARMGDEINEVKKAANYGWPLATFSIEYSGQPISDKTSIPGMEDPIVAWNPNPAPCGLAVYKGRIFPKWEGDLLSGGLAGSDIRRIDLDANGKVVGQTKFRIGTRVRDVRVGPDGYIYFLTDEVNGRLMKIEPA